MPRYIFDLETDGLLDDVTTIHCMVIKDIDTGQALGYTGKGIWTEGIPKLEKADMICGHNIIKYDIPVLQKLGTFNPQGQTRDTLVCTRLVWADVKQADFTRTDFPKKLIGSHSLAAWGHRIGNYKDDYNGGWEAYNDEMLEYCFQDVEVTNTLWKKIEAKNYSEQSIELEHEVAELIYRQEQAGFAFDKETAGKLYAKLSARKQELTAKLLENIPPWQVKLKTKTKFVEFNPASRDQCAKVLKQYGWEPEDFSPAGKPKVDETTLAQITNSPEGRDPMLIELATIMGEYFLLIKRLGQLGDGNQAWLKVERGGRIHGSCNTNGAVTGRATHAYPNVAQVPSCGAPYGKDCRELFTVGRGKKLVGVDVSGLELRCLAHYMARYDGGAYGETVVNGDIHTANQEAAGLATRPQAKTFIYGFLYGAGAGKLGSIVGKGAKEGALLKARFLKKLPALANLIERVQKAAERGYIIGLDGRHLKVRSPHSALNVLLQSAGALICKQWMVEFDKALKDKGLSESCQQVAWVHDEIQLETKEDMAHEIGELAVECIKRAGDHFSIRCELTGEYNIGNNWAETH